MPLDDAPNAAVPFPLTEDERLLTRPEVAEILRISLSSLEKWGMAGYGPKYVKIGRQARFRLRDVRAFIDGRQSSPSPQLPSAP